MGNYAASNMERIIRRSISLLLIAVFLLSAVSGVIPSGGRECGIRWWRYFLQCQVFEACHLL